MIRELKGYHVLAIAVACFAIVIGANLAMLFAATGSFPGLVVENSYVASQKWNARAAAQQALGWQASVAYEDGAILVRLTDADGAPVEGLELRGSVGRPTSASGDRALEFRGDGGGYTAPAELAPGRWRVDFVTADGPDYRATARLVVEAR